MARRIRLFAAGLAMTAAAVTGLALTAVSVPPDTTWGSHATTNDTTWGTPPADGDGGGQEPPTQPGDTTWG